MKNKPGKWASISSLISPMKSSPPLSWDNYRPSAEPSKSKKSTPDSEEASIGETLESSPQSRTKDNVDLAGLLLPLPLTNHIKSKTKTNQKQSTSVNNNWLTVPMNLLMKITVATEVMPPELYNTLRIMDRPLTLHTHIKPLHNHAKPRLEFTGSTVSVKLLVAHKLRMKSKEDHWLFEWMLPTGRAMHQVFSITAISTSTTLFSWWVQLKIHGSLRTHGAPLGENKDSSD